MPAIENNVNSVRHGLRSKREYSLASLGRGFERVADSASRLRSVQEARIRALGHELTDKQYRTIQCACVKEQRYRAASKHHRTLAKRLHDQPQMPTAELLEVVKAMEHLEAVADKAMSEREKILTRLHLDTAPADPFATLRAQQAQANGGQL